MATRLKTIEYAFDMLTSVANNTLTNFTQLTLHLPESSKVFKSVELVVTTQDVNTTTTAVNYTSRRIDLRLGSVAYSTITNANAVTQCGENIAITCHRDYTSYFSTNWSGTSMTVDVAVLFAMATAYAQANVTARLFITYEYDDTSATHIKTVYIPLNAPSDRLATTRPATAFDTIPALDTYLPEASKVYRDMFIWFGANRHGGSSTTDTVVSHQIDSATAVTTGIHEGAMASDIWTEHIFKPTFTTDATHEYRAWVSTGALTAYSCPQVYLVVTYEFNPSTTTSVMNSVLLPMEWESPAGGSSADDFQRAKRNLNIQEPGTITLQRMALLIDYEQPVSLASNVRLRIGTGSWEQQLNTIGVVVGGQCGFMIRNDSAISLARGNNVLQADAYSASVNLTPYNMSSLWIINYTSGKHTDGVGAHNHTVYYNIHTHGTGAAVARTISAATPFIEIPETNYFINGAGMIFEYITNGTVNNTGVIIQAEKLVSEGGLEWASVYVDSNACDPEIGIHRNYAQARTLFNRWTNDADPNRLDIEASRRFRTAISDIGLTAACAYHERLSSLVTYHTITKTISGVTYNKDGNALGSCDVLLFRDTGSSNLELIQKTTSNASTGAYSFTVYDDTINYAIASRKTGSPNVFDITDFNLSPS